MKEITTARERVLKNIRNANLKVDKNKRIDIDHESDIYHAMDDDRLIQFAEQYNAWGGQFVYCANERELAANLLAWIDKNDLLAVGVKDTSLQQFCNHYKIPVAEEIPENGNRMAALTLAEHLVARTGSIAIKSSGQSGRTLPFTAQTLLVIAYDDQLVDKVEDSMKKWSKDKQHPSSFFSYISGPSQTADIEKTLVKGVHGPKEVVLFLLESNQ